MSRQHGSAEPGCFVADPPRYFADRRSRTRGRTFAGDWLYLHRRYSELRKPNRVSEIFYPRFLLAVVAAYAWRYGG